MRNLAKSDDGRAPITVRRTPAVSNGDYGM